MMRFTAHLTPPSGWSQFPSHRRIHFQTSRDGATGRGTSSRRPEPHPVHAEALLPHATDLLAQLPVAARPRRPPAMVRLPGLAFVVRRRGDRQHVADRLDPVLLAVRVDEPRHFLGRRSSSACTQCDGVCDGRGWWLRVPPLLNSMPAASRRGAAHSGPAETYPAASRTRSRSESVARSRFAMMCSSVSSFAPAMLPRSRWSRIS